ncbi:MAG: hypothetical protein CSA75_01260 [Sorangium cellulosum]|nr:MAG: hypothetical protein CSA75_01260 [Sorangium cellulosum]
MGSVAFRAGFLLLSLMSAFPSQARRYDSVLKSFCWIGAHEPFQHAFETIEHFLFGFCQGACLSAKIESRPRPPSQPWT